MKKIFITIMALLTLASCGKQKRTSLNDIIKADKTIVYKVETDNFNNNYRLKIYSKQPNSIYFNIEGDNLILYVSGILENADTKLSNLPSDFPCQTFTKTVETYLIYALKCENNIRIFPEYNKDSLDIILQKQ